MRRLILILTTVLPALWSAPALAQSLSSVGHGAPRQLPSSAMPYVS